MLAGYPQLQCAFGSVADDFERSARVAKSFWGVVRFRQLVVVKRKKPGLFVEEAGGISSLFKTKKAQPYAVLFYDI